MKCCQCENIAMFMVGPNNEFPLCLHCLTKLKQAETEKLKTLQRMVEHSEQLMDYMAGFGPPPKPVAISEPSNMTFNNINVSNSNIGMINTGKVYAETIDLAISSLKNHNQLEVAKALKEMTEAVLRNQEMDNINREKLMELLSYIAEESIKPATYRKKHLIMDNIEKVTQCVSLIESIKKVWDYAYPIIKNFFC